MFGIELFHHETPAEKERKDRIRDEQMRRKKKTGAPGPKKAAVPRPGKQAVAPSLRKESVLEQKAVSTSEEGELQESPLVAKVMEENAWLYGNTTSAEAPQVSTEALSVKPDEAEEVAAAAMNDLESALSESEEAAVTTQREPIAAVVEAPDVRAVEQVTADENSPELQERLLKIKDQMKRLVSLSGRRVKTAGMSVADAKAQSENFDHARKVIEKIRTRVVAIEKGATAALKMEEIAQLESELAQALWDMGKEVSPNAETVSDAASEGEATVEQSKAQAEQLNVMRDAIRDLLTPLVEDESEGADALRTAGLAVVEKIADAENILDNGGTPADDYTNAFDNFKALHEAFTQEVNESSDDTQEVSDARPEKLTAAQVYDRYRDEIADVEERVAQLVTAHPELTEQPAYVVYVQKLDRLKAQLVDDNTAKSHFSILRPAIASLERDFNDFEHKVLSEGLITDQEVPEVVDVEGAQENLPPLELFAHAEQQEEGEKQVQQRDRISKKLEALVTENSSLADTVEYQVSVSQLEELGDNDSITHEKLIAATDALMELQRVGIAQKVETIRAQEAQDTPLVLTDDMRIDGPEALSDAVQAEVAAMAADPKGDTFEFVSPNEEETIEKHSKTWGAGELVIIPRSDGSESEATILKITDGGKYRVVWEEDGITLNKDIAAEDLRAGGEGVFKKGDTVIVPRSDGSESVAQVDGYIAEQDAYAVSWEEDGDKMSKVVGSTLLKEGAVVAAETPSEDIGDYVEPDIDLLQSQEQWRAAGQEEVAAAEEETTAEAVAEVPRIFGSAIPPAGAEGRFAARAFKDGLLLMRGRVEDAAVQKKIDDVLRVVGYVPDSGLREADVAELGRLAREINTPESLLTQRFDHIDKMYAEVDAKVREKLQALGQKEGGKKSRGLMGRSTVLRWFSGNKSKE